MGGFVTAPVTKARWVPLSHTVVVIALAAVAIGFLAAHAASGHGHYPPEWEFTLPLGMVSGFLGDILLRRRPDQKIGWVVAAIGLIVLLQTAVTAYADYSLYVHPLPHPAGVFAVAGFCGGTLVPLLATLFLIFPTGTIPGPRWRPLAVAIPLAFLVGLPGQVGGSPSDTDFPQLPNPAELHSALVRHVNDVVNIAQIFILLACAASVAVRWRRSGDVVRRQIKVLLAAAALWPPVVLILVTAPTSFTDGVWGQLLFATPVLTMVVAVFVAVVRYRLYDVDRIISRTVSYAVVTGILVGCYVGAVALATRLLPFSSGVGVAASTLMVAALFQPLRRQVQRTVDRRFNRERYDTARVVDAFSVRLRDEVDPERVRTDLLAVTARAVEPAVVSLWVAG